MKPPAHLLIALLALVAACGGAGSTSNPATPLSTDNAAGPAGLPANSDILRLVYDSNYSVPDGFFVDERAVTTRSYTIHHVLDDSHSYELCTDDFATAQSWEEADNAARSVQGYFVTSYENERYFEFVRELSYNDDIGNIEDVTSPGFGRIFKCSNLSRDGVDRGLTDGYAGRINARPLTPASVRIFTEYLWQFSFFPVARKKVIQSNSDTGSETIQHTLLLALATNQGFDRCDLVEVVAWRFSADHDSGHIDRNFEVLRSFEARMELGVPVICD